MGQSQTDHLFPATNPSSQKPPRCFSDLSHSFNEPKGMNPLWRITEYLKHGQKLILPAYTTEVQSHWHKEKKSQQTKIFYYQRSRENSWFCVLVRRNTLVTLMPTKTQITNWQVHCTSRKDHNKQHWSLLDAGVFTTGETGKYCPFFSFPSENSLSTPPAVQQSK